MKSSGHSRWSVPAKPSEKRARRPDCGGARAPCGSRSRQCAQDPRDRPTAGLIPRHPQAVARVAARTGLLGQDKPHSRIRRPTADVRPSRPRRSPPPTGTSSATPTASHYSPPATARQHIPHPGIPPPDGLSVEPSPSYPPVWACRRHSPLRADERPGGVTGQDKPHPELRPPHRQVRLLPGRRS